MSTSEMNGVRSFTACTSVMEDLPQPIKGNMQDIPESVLRNSVIELRVGMEFDSLLEVTEFYKNYTYSKGFATMIMNSRKNKGFTETSYINLKCNRERTYSSSVDDTSKKRSTIKNSCENHNHDLSPSKSRYFAAFQYISTDTRRRLLINDNADARVNSSIKSSIVEAGGYENVTYNQKDVHNFLNKEHRLKCREGDGQALHDYFVKMQVKLAGLEAYQDIKYYLLKAVHQSMTVEEFEELWNHTITSHHLEENEWLANLYEERERWVLAFLNSNFFVGMSYILDRWRKVIKRKHTYVSTCTDDVQHNPVLESYEKLHRLAVGVLEIGAESVENFNVLEKLLIDLKDNFPRSCDKQPLSQRKNSVGTAFDVVRTEVIKSPMVVKRKGRPRTKQLKVINRGSGFKTKEEKEHCSC
uniref:Uncharacterized protein n=1 Tax=Fagus sylvatica TaxID=28930 RepID=A0A2N9G3T8_FAGSY